MHHLIKGSARFALACVCVLVLAACANKSTAPMVAETDRQARIKPPSAIAPSDKPRVSELDAALKSKNYNEAERLAGALATDYPNNPEFPINLGVIDLKQGKLEDALEHLKEGLRLDPNNVHGLVFQGEVQVALGLYEDAAASYTKALNGDANQYYAHYGLGVVYDLYLMDFDKAEKHYQAFLELAPKDLYAQEIKRVTAWKRLLDRKR